jgi:hypothetical protein
MKQPHRAILMVMVEASPSTLKNPQRLTPHASSTDRIFDFKKQSHRRTDLAECADGLSVHTRGHSAAFMMMLWNNS